MAMENVNYRAMSMVLLAATEALYAAVKHRGLECDDITLVYGNDDGSTTETTTTVEIIIASAQHALGVPKREYIVKDSEA